MPQILQGKPIVQSLKTELATKIKHLHVQDHYLAILFFGDNVSSSTYVTMKKRFGEDIGLQVKVIGQTKDKGERPDKGHHRLVGAGRGKSKGDESSSLDPLNLDPFPLSLESVKNLIHQLNHDDKCLGMILQLPLPDHLYAYTNELCCSVLAHKDVDGLGGALLGYAQTGIIDFQPATPGAVLRILDFYERGNVRGKTIAVLGQSNLVGKPLVGALMNRGATVHSCNSKTSPEYMKQLCQQSDIIIACTGKIHLVNDEYVRVDQTQVIIDVGYGHRGGKAVGDVYLSSVHERVAAYTPVPGGVGPVTVAQLFANTIKLFELRNTLPSYNNEHHQDQ